MADSREHILQTAQNLFLQKGFKEVTMKELVETAGLSKGAFYHYFTSKEQVFEEVIFAYAEVLKVPDYDKFSTTSLQDFYKNLLQFFYMHSRLSKTTVDDSAFSQNHYYLIFDGIRLVPKFKEMFDKRMNDETAAWIKIIDIAKKSKEINTTVSSRQVAKMFISAADGLTLNMLMLGRISTLNNEISKIWSSIYTLLKT